MFVSKESSVARLSTKPRIRGQKSNALIEKKRGGRKRRRVETTTRVSKSFILDTRFVTGRSFSCLPVSSYTRYYDPASAATCSRFVIAGWVGQPTRRLIG